jgi:hypothetical protein
MLFAGKLHPGQFKCAAIRPTLCSVQFTTIGAVGELSSATGSARWDCKAPAKAVRAAKDWANAAAGQAALYKALLIA